MRGWAKILVGFLTVLVLLCICGGLALVMTGGLDKIKGIAGGVTKITRSAKAVEEVDRKFPFTPPESGEVTEERLQAYLAVCSKIKPALGPYEAWMNAHQGRQGSFKEAQEAINLTGNAFNAMGDALVAAGMSGREFFWIDKAMLKAGREAGGSSDITIRMLGTLKSLAGGSGLSERERERLRSQIVDFEAEIKAQSEATLTPNGLLYAKYSKELKENDPGEFGRMMLQGLGQEHHGRQRRLEK